MDNELKKDVCIQFSGGTDSTYVAYLMSLEFEKVHLLTFYHSYQEGYSKDINENTGVTKSARGFETLNKKFPGKFEHVYIDVNDLMLRMANRNHFKNLVKYRFLTIFFGCFICQASFHIRSIVYCLKHNIFDVRNGANTEYSDASPMQIEIVMKEINKFYLDYGITLDSPIYKLHEEKRSDHLLYDLGLRAERNVKGDEDAYKKYQIGTCKLGSCGGLGVQYWKRKEGYPKIVQTQLREHWLEEVAYYKSIIEQEIH